MANEDTLLALLALLAQLVVENGLYGPSLADDGLEPSEDMVLLMYA